MEKREISREDATSHNSITVFSAYNDFLIRLEYLRSRNPDWTNPKNQNRPFKSHFIGFIRDLTARLPVVPEIIPTSEGNVLFKYRKRAPRDKWQVMEITVTPQRRFNLIVKSRIPSQPPFTKNNLARPDFLSDLIQIFFENDAVTAKEHPVFYRSATTIDYPAIGGICTAMFGPNAKYSPKQISKMLEYCVVADDPLYGIVSFAALQKTPDSGDKSLLKYEISAIFTTQPLRGMGIGGKCLRKAISNVLADHPDAELSAKIPLKDEEDRDNCRGILIRSGFARTKMVRGENRYTQFCCDRCNLDRCYCNPDTQGSVCTTVYYELIDRGGKLGYGGGHQTC